MRPIMIQQAFHSETEVCEEAYPFKEFIINRSASQASNCELVSWLFPNKEMVQLLFFSPNDAEIFYLSPSIILPEEGVEGIFYTRSEIQLFLSKVKDHS